MYFIYILYQEKLRGARYQIAPPSPAGPFNEKEKAEDHISVEY